MYNRPKKTETEEDVLKLQEEFLRQSAANKVTPAARVVKDTNYDKTHENVKPIPPIQLASTFETIPDNYNIGGILEKTYDDNQRPTVTCFDKKGFPQAKRRDPTLSGSKSSIFSQQFKRLKKETADTSSSPTLTIKENTPANLPHQSYVITGQDKQTIHLENVAILQQMSESDIIKERQALLETMDPAIVAFLKSQRRKAPIINRNSSIAEQNKAAEHVKLDEVEATKGIIAQSENEKWLNFDTVELNKLAWMANFDVPHDKDGKQYEARFDFGGWLLPFTHPAIDETNRILYHHGDEPGRPGYTLQELFQLCRSSINQQQIIALNTISNILSLYQSGVYDGVIEIPFEQIFFVLRICLDDNTPSVLNAAIRAVRNLFVYVIDETCLDNLLGFGLGMVQPLLAVDCEEIEDDNTVNDQQLAETNLVKCLARTDILKRIRYIIDVVKPSLETIVHCLEILTRLSRDSNFIVDQIYKCEGLLESIAKNFVPATTSSVIDSPYGCPLMQAVKLFRVLAVRDLNSAKLAINRYKIMDSVAYYLSSEGLSVNSSGLKLQIESMHFWGVLLHYNLAENYFSVLEPILLRMLDFHVRNTNLHPSSYVIQGHIAALLNLLNKATQNHNFIAILKGSAMSKWKEQFCNLPEFSCGKLQLVSALLKCMSNFSQSVENMEDSILNLLQSGGFEIVTKNIKLCSNLLNNYETHKIGANFHTVEAAAWNASDHIIPVLQTNSCLPFVSALSEFVDTFDSAKVKLAFLKHKNIVEYLQNLSNAKSYSLVTNWFTRIESSLVINILRIAITVQNELETLMFYKVAVKSLCVFNAEQKSGIQYILTNIIFNRHFYPCEMLMSNLDLSQQNSLLSVGLQNLENICSVYTQVLNLNMVKQDNLLVSLNTTIIPADWIYSPVILFYSDPQSAGKTIPEDQQVFVITNCLRWIFIYETYFPTLASDIHPTDRFCRIACTFLCSDTLFLNREVHYLLENCLKRILDNDEANINFSRTIQGLNNFQDFYTLLLEQYQGVSYGNLLFGNFILLPLMQRHNIKYRKTLWSEYAGILQIFNVTPDEVLCPIDSFLQPAEKDLSLLKCYKRAIMTGSIRKNSVLYKIAEHHLKAYVDTKKNSVSIT